MPYVYSSLTSPNEYVEWIKQGDQTTIAKSVRIEGGSGVMNKNFLTPLGIVTEVSDADLEFLMKNDHFKFHMENGFIKVDKKKMDTEKAVSDMNLQDGSAPFTPADYVPGGRAYVPGVEMKAPTVTGTM